jgi:glutathione synthase/RimK-type ligase-like ATP-grasp enzyme
LPSSLFNQFNKTYYLQIAYRYGFKVPHFIITDQLDKRAEEILETKDWVNKSISTNQFIGNRRFTTTRFNKQTLYKKESHLGIPILFQEYIKPEFEIRLFFMLETTYSIAIKRKKGSLEDDIRVIDASNLEVEEVSTPDYINKSVVSYCKENYFNYCCFDFLYSSDAYYLIDINPFGSWKYYEENFNIPITDKFVNAIEKYINTLKLHT